VEKEKNKSGLILLIIGLFILVLGLGGYIVYDKFLSDNSIKINNNSQDPIVDNNTKEETTEKYFYDVKDLKVKGISEYQVFADISKMTNVVETLDFVDFGFENYIATLDLSGNVTVLKYSESGNEKYITGKLNVTGVIDVVQFQIPGMEEADQLLYLLTDNGNVYYYRIGDIEKNSFNATKVESVSNVKKIFISYFSKPNAGSSWALFAITGDNDCIMIEGVSV